MEKVLFVSHLANFVKFNKAFMKWFQEQGWEVHYVSLDEEEIPFCDKHFKVDFNRSPYSLDNMRAYRQLKRIIDRENYSIIHCHTPMGGVVTRLAARAARKRGTKVLYTAHGFHFYKGAPLINWLLYYTMEKFLARYTDSLITINQEDYECANQKRFQSQKIFKIDGVGVDLNRFKPVDPAAKLDLREEFAIPKEAFVLLTVAEFTKNKNQAYIIHQVARLRQEIPSLFLILAGKGEQLEACKKLATDLGVEDIVFFLGYCREIEKIYPLADVLISASFREGLPINLIEGMSVGLPVVCTSIRGQIDLINAGENGLFYSIKDPDGLMNCIRQLYSEPELCRRIADNNIQKARNYSTENAVKTMAQIYGEYMERVKV